MSGTIHIHTIQRLLPDHRRGGGADGSGKLQADEEGEETGEERFHGCSFPGRAVEVFPLFAIRQTPAKPARPVRHGSYGGENFPVIYGSSAYVPGEGVRKLAFTMNQLGNKAQACRRDSSDQRGDFVSIQPRELNRESRSVLHTPDSQQEIAGSEGSAPRNQAVEDVCLRVIVIKRAPDLDQPR